MKDKLRAGDIILFKYPHYKHRMGSYLITLFTDSPYCHCGLMMDEENMIHADYGDGVFPVPFKDVVNDYADYDVGFFRGIDVAKQIEYCVDKIGYKYNYKGILGIIIHKIFRVFKSDLFQSNREFYCSEMIINSAIDQGYCQVKEYEKDTGDFQKIKGFEFRIKRTFK